MVKICGLAHLSPLDKRKDVEFTDEANEQLTNIITNDDAEELEFYGKSTGRDKSDEGALDSLKKCIIEVLSVDVRSKWQTSKARRGKSRAETSVRVKEMKVSDIAQDGSEFSAKVCTQQLDRLLIKFTVKEGQPKSTECAVDTEGSGADDSIMVLGITLMPKK